MCEINKNFKIITDVEISTVEIPLRKTPVPIFIVAVCMKCHYLQDYAILAIFVLHNVFEIKI